MSSEKRLSGKQIPQKLSLKNDLSNYMKPFETTDDFESIYISNSILGSSQKYLHISTL